MGAIIVSSAAGYDASGWELENTIDRYQRLGLSTLIYNEIRLYLFEYKSSTVKNAVSTR